MPYLSVLSTLIYIRLFNAKAQRRKEHEGLFVRLPLHGPTQINANVFYAEEIQLIHLREISGINTLLPCCS
jgi:hypothetical protein